MKRFNPREIETKWQKYWDQNHTYKADLNSSKTKYIAMSMFNYPSGAGIHIGHAMNYTISDVLARFKRQQGYESYHPVGWDAFGLPAENYAIKAGVSPQESMAKIIPDYHKQYKAMGWSNDWSKEISTHLPEYYKWTQWIFSEIYRAGLAYQDARTQWWCTKCQTVLANEQVIDGKCWRHDSPEDPTVEKKEVTQWFFKITDYADELLEAIDDLDWSESVKLAQKNWIGKSKGAEIVFAIDGSDKELNVFTTRPDTLFGATFMVLAPENNLIEEITTESQRTAVEDYVKQAEKKTEVERQTSKEKTGAFTGAFAINPVNNKKIPIWVADYVLAGYGTGAIMAVPAHDERDYEFADKYQVNKLQVVAPSFVLDGVSTPRDEESLPPVRPCVDAIITNSEGKFLLIREPEGNLTHFVGGGIDEGESDIEALKREVLEESGFEIKGEAQFVTELYSLGYRISKKKNQLVRTKFFLVTVDDTKQIRNESDEGKHELIWVDKYDVGRMINWQHHSYGWSQYMELGCFTEEGVLINSGEYDGMPSGEAREKIVADLVNKGLAKEKTQYKINDWSVSRQRYWGAPIPIIHCEKCGVVLVEDKDLPVVLPELDDFQPSGDGRSALARAKDWLELDCPKCGGRAERETDTLDTYICSSWYMLRYNDPNNSEKIFDSSVINKWMPIDFYNGADHATAHMIYARFITRFLQKQGLLENPEPFKKFLFNGKVTAPDGQMFSKSKGNGVDPLEIINNGYGADALRTYLMFAAPLDVWVKWDEHGVPGTHRFLSRIWTLVQEYLDRENTSTDGAGEDINRTINKTIFKVTHDIEELKYNTAIASMMACVNDLYKIKAKENFSSESWQASLESLVQLVAPFAPHMAEELWHDLGHEDSIQVDHWPGWDEKYLSSETLIIVVQVNGKLRANIVVDVDASKEEIENLALSDENVQKYTENKKPTKVIYVPGRLVNVVL